MFGKPGNTACASIRFVRYILPLINRSTHPIDPEVFSRRSRKLLPVGVGGENRNVRFQTCQFGSFTWHSAD